MTGKRRNTVLRPFMRRGLKAWSLGLAAAAVLTFLFYRSALMLPALLPLAFYFAGQYERERGKKRLLETSGQLKDGLLALGASVRAGHSAENAFLIFFAFLHEEKDMKVCREIIGGKDGGKIGIFAWTDYVAMELYRTIRAAGAMEKIGSSVRIIGCDNSPFCNSVDPPLTSVDPAFRELGFAAMNYLLECLKNPDASRPPLPEPRLVRRESA